MGASHFPEPVPSGGSGTRGRVAGRVESLRRASLSKALFGAFGVTLVIIAGAFVVLALSVNALLGDAAQNSRSDEVLQRSAMSERLVIDLETGLRGYLLTGQSRFLNPYVDARAALAGELPRLELMVADNPAQLARARQLAGAVASYVRVYGAAVLASDARLTQAQKVASASQGKRLMDALRSRFAVFNREQQHLSEPAAERDLGQRAHGHGSGGVRIRLGRPAAGAARGISDAGRADARYGASRERRCGWARAITAPACLRAEAVRSARWRARSTRCRRTLEQRERALRITNERFQGVLDNANAAIYIKDTTSRYLLVNREFERIAR